jgi:hypothetical protein
MSNTYLTALLLTVVTVLLCRFLFRFLPIRGVAARMSLLDLTACVVGSLALALHCGAMFFRSIVHRWPGGSLVIRTVDPLGISSIVWFAVAASLVMFGLRRQNVLAVTIAAVSLGAVGLTMYNGGPLNQHLAAIFSAVVLLTAILSVLVLPPWRDEPKMIRLGTGVHRD